MQRNARPTVVLLFLLAAFGGFAWLTRHPESPWIREAQEWPVVGPLAQWFRSKYLGPEPAADQPASVEEQPATPRPGGDTAVRPAVEASSRRRPADAPAPAKESSVSEGPRKRREKVEVYLFKDDYFGYPEPRTVTGRVLNHGSRYRVELDPSDEARAFDVLLSMDGGRTETALNLENQTFYDLDTKSAAATSQLYQLLPLGDRRARDTSLQVSEEASGEVPGFPTRKVTFRLAYKVVVEFAAEKVRGNVESKATFWLTDHLSLPLPSNLRPRIRTGFAHIDRQLEEALADLRGWPIQQQITITAQVKGEEARTSTTTRTVQIGETTEAPPQAFQVPNGFTYREPVKAGPGR